MNKEIVGLISAFLAIAVTCPYLWKVYRGYTYPHVFTWVIWTLTTSISAAARTSVHTGPGAWGQWASAISCFSVVIFSLFKGKHHITRSDIVTFLFALSAIPAWILTQNPLTAVIIITFIDGIGYYPTFRKSYHDPHHEVVFNYFASNISVLLSLIATTTYSITSVLFPIVVFVLNSALIIFVLLRRRKVVKDGA